MSIQGSGADLAHHDPMALDLPCPNCGTQMYAEQAHNRCPACLYYEPCCDGAPQFCRSAQPKPDALAAAAPLTLHAPVTRQDLDES